MADAAGARRGAKRVRMDARETGGLEANDSGDARPPPKASRASRARAGSTEAPGASDLLPEAGGRAAGATMPVGQAFNPPRPAPKNRRAPKASAAAVQPAAAAATDGSMDAAAAAAAAPAAASRRVRVPAKRAADSPEQPSAAAKKAKTGAEKKAEAVAAAAAAATAKAEAKAAAKAAKAAAAAADKVAKKTAAGSGSGGSADAVGGSGDMAHRHKDVRDAAAALDFDGVYDDDDEEPPPVLDPRMDF